MKKLHVIVDLQFGSCGKGLYAGWLAKKIQADTIITSWSPNAGHTFVDKNGHSTVTCALPSGLVSPSVKRVLIGPGSIINPEQFMNEYETLLGDCSDVRIFIHENAAVVGPEHRLAEKQYGFKIGSTMKGVGEAVIQKIRREPDHINTAVSLIGTPLEGFLTSREEYNRQMDLAEVAIIEGAQGFSLSINQGFYPYTTSRDCTVNALLSDCAVPHRTPTTVHGVCRVLPIRVANRYDENGKQVGTSGPCYPDQRELTWEELGIPPEYTTVTKLKRRVFTWSNQQMREAIRMNHVDHIFLNFVNYLHDPWELHRMMEVFSHNIGEDRILFGVGPRENDVVGIDELLFRMNWKGV